MSDDAVRGYTQMNKEHLLAALCKAFNIDMHAHHKIATVPHKEEIKGQIKELKKKRDAALQAHDHAALKDVRHLMHELRRKLRRAAGKATKKKAARK